MTGAPLVSVVAVSWNTRADLKRCLASLLEHTTSCRLELMVVDNASVDDTPEMVRDSFPEAKLLVNDVNVGFACACNQGMAAASGDLLLLLNSDTYVTDDVIGRAARHLLDRPRIGMLGCELRYPGGRRQHTANRALSVRYSLFDRLWLHKLVPSPRREKLLLGGYWEGDHEIEVDWLAGAFVMLRREVFERSGGFDERFFMYGEDSEWCMRLRRQGTRILYAPQVGVVHHTGSVSVDRVWTERQRLEHCYRGGLASYAMVYGRPRAALYLLAELVGTSVRFAAYRAASVVRPGDGYIRQQAAFYGWLARFYLSSGVPALRTSKLA